MALQIGAEFQYTKDGVGANWVVAGGNGDPIDFEELALAKMMLDVWLTAHFTNDQLVMDKKDRFWYLKFPCRRALMLFKLHWGTEHFWRFSTS